MAPQATPVPIPAFAPVLSPDDSAVLEGSAGFDADWVAAKVPGLLEEVVDIGVEAVPELCRLAGVELERCLVSVLAATSIVLVGFPAKSNRNLPTPVWQQLFV